MQEHIDSVPPKAEKEILSPFLFSFFKCRFWKTVEKRESTTHGFIEKMKA
jgi:hypothetical protein